MRLIHASFEDSGIICLMVENSIFGIFPSPIKIAGKYVPTHVVTLTQVRTSVYLGQTHLGTPLQVPAWVRKFSLGSTGDEIFSLIIIQSLFVQQKFEY